jgi:hypothetical protein
MATVNQSTIKDVAKQNQFNASPLRPRQKRTETCVCGGNGRMTHRNWNETTGSLTQKSNSLGRSIDGRNESIVFVWLVRPQIPG